MGVQSLVRQVLLLGLLSINNEYNMRYHINDILKFIRIYDTSGIYHDKSNTQLRKHIRACLEKERFYFITRSGYLLGFIEWYRIKDCQYLVRRVREKKFLNCNPSGTLIYIQNAVFRKGYLTLKVFKRFMRYHKNIKNIIWFRHKNKKFTSIKIKS